MHSDFVELETQYSEVQSELEDVKIEEAKLQKQIDLHKSAADKEIEKSENLKFEFSEKQSELETEIATMRAELSKEKSEFQLKIVGKDQMLESLQHETASLRENLRESQEKFELARQHSENEQQELSKKFTVKILYCTINL